MNSKAVKTADISVEQLERIEKLLGRAPRGLLTIELFDQAGEPAVLRVAPLVESKPFPTLFWLIHPQINYWLDGLEASGVIAKLQAEINSGAVSVTEMARYHAWYVQERWQSASQCLQDEICRLGYREVLEQKGVGGLGDFSRVRCLHTWYGAHLISPNPVGNWLDSHEDFRFAQLEEFFGDSIR